MGKKGTKGCVGPAKKAYTAVHMYIHTYIDKTAWYFPHARGRVRAWGISAERGGGNCARGVANTPLVCAEEEASTARAGKKQQVHCQTGARSAAAALNREKWQKKTAAELRRGGNSAGSTISDKTPVIQRVLAHSFWVLQAVTPVECVRGPRQGAEVWKSVFSVFCLTSWAVCTRKSVGETCLLRRSGGVGKIQVVFGRGAKLEHGRLQGLCQTLHKQSTPVSRARGLTSAAVGVDLRGAQQPPPARTRPPQVRNAEPPPLPPQGLPGRAAACPWLLAHWGVCRERRCRSKAALCRVAPRAISTLPAGRARAARLASVPVGRGLRRRTPLWPQTSRRKNLPWAFSRGC